MIHTIKASDVVLAAIPHENSSGQARSCYATTSPSNGFRYAEDESFPAIRANYNEPLAQHALVDTTSALQVPHIILG